MFKSYLNTAIRSMVCNKITTLISIGGLALGMCCALLIFLYIQFEISFDSFHKKQDLIFRVLVEGEKQNGEREYRSSIAHELADKLIHDSISRDLDPRLTPNKETFPENRIRKSRRLEKFFPMLSIPDLPGSHYITDVVRMSPQSGNVRYKEQIFEEDYLYFTEPAVLRMFDLPLQKGNPTTALSEPGSILVTPEMADKYFASENPLGKTIRFELPFAPSLSFKVTGVLRSIPKNSSMQINFLATFPWDDLKSYLPQNQPLYTYTYIEFGGVKRRHRQTMFQTILRDLFIWDKPIHVDMVATDFCKELARIDIPDFYADHFYSNWHFTIEPFHSVYLARDRIFTSFNGAHVETIKQGDIFSILLLFALALLILAISCINVMSLFTARSASRAREIAIRKVMGADRSRLIFQFFTESTLLSSISLVFALSLVELLLPGFSLMVGRELSIDYANNWGYISTMAGLAFMAGLFSGIYPAFFLSSFPVLETMKGENLPASKRLRQWLMVFQISSSVCILLFTLFLSKESSFLRKLPPGFQTKDILFFKIDHADQKHTYQDLKRELLNISGVSYVTASSLVAWEYGVAGVSTFSAIDNPHQDRDNTIPVRVMLADPDYLKVYQIDVVAGQDFDQSSVDFGDSYIINQTAHRLLIKEDLSSKKIRVGNSYPAQVKGIARDFHFNYPWQKIEPLVIMLSNEYYGLQRSYISVRLQPTHPNNILEQIGNTVTHFYPENIFSFRYVDQEIERINNSMNYSWEMILKFASAVAISLATLGLAGFAGYEAERRIKEFGIRKALGAARLQICLSFVQQFIPIVLVANVIAGVISSLTINKLLQRIDYPWPFRMGLPVFMYSCSLTLLISLIIVGVLIFRAASVEPAKALRDE